MVDDGGTANGGLNTSLADTITIDVTAANDAPVISNIANQTTNEDVTESNVAFTITDVDHTLVCATSVTATSSNTSVIANGNISI